MYVGLTHVILPDQHDNLSCLSLYWAKIPWTGAKSDIIHMFDVVSKQIP